MGMIKDAVMKGPERIPEIDAKPKKCTCPIHGKYDGYETKIAMGVIDSACPMCIEEERLSDLIEAKEAELKRIQKHAERNSALNRSCVPERYRGSSLEEWIAENEDQEKAKDRMTQYIENFKLIRKRGVPCLFTGGTGTGKTMMATAVLNQVIRKGFTGVYISSLNFLSLVKSTWVKGSERSEDEVIEQFVAYDLLVIDELGKGILSEKEKFFIFRLLDRRSEDLKPTIGISIYSLKKLAGRIDYDTVRRLKGNGGQVIEFKWDEYETEDLF